MDFHNNAGLGYYTPSTTQHAYSHSSQSVNPHPQHFEQQQPSNIPHNNRYEIYGDYSGPIGANFVPPTGLNINETASDPPSGLPPPPVGLSQPSGPMPAYLQHSQMLPSFFIPLRDGPPHTISIPHTDTTLQQQQLIEEGRNKAMEILQQFGAVQQMKESQIEEIAETGRNNQKLQMMNNRDGHLFYLDSLPPEEWARRRRVCLERLQQKYETAVFRNFEYVARVGEERLKAQAKQLQDAERYHSEMETYHIQVLHHRARAYATVRNKDYSFTVAGIGTQQRQKAERKRKQNHTGSQQHDSSVSIYVSNLPKDGSASEELMRALFGSYGRLRKIHFYMDKQTGQLKGDALVIYNTSVDDNYDRSQEDVKSSIVEAVCTQMNGAELSCGTCIKVEPSDPIYPLRKEQETPNYFGGAGNEGQQTAALVKAKAAEVEYKEELSAMGVEEGAIKPETGDEENGQDGEDLDDFFASL